MLPHALWGSNKRNTKERANISHATIGFYTQKDSHALVHFDTCLMGEEHHDNVKTVVRASTCFMGEENAKIQKIKYVILLYGNQSEVISRHGHIIIL